MHWFLDPITNHYFDFKSRTTRQQYWMFILFYFIVSLIVSAFDRVLGIEMLAPILSLGLLIPTLAIAVRRYHDIGLSGWVWFLLGLFSTIFIIAAVVMLFGAIFTGSGVEFFYVLLAIGVAMKIANLYFLIKKGDVGVNKYGSDPYSSLSDTTTPEAATAESATPQLTSTPIPKPAPAEPEMDNAETPEEENTQRGYGSQ